MFQVPALRIEQRGVAMFVTALPLEELRKHITVDYWCPDNEDGYQRPLDRKAASRGCQIRYGRAGCTPHVHTDVYPTPGRFRPPRPTRPQRSRWSVSWTMGDIEHPRVNAALWVIDGQHRSFGVKSRL